MDRTGDLMSALLITLLRYGFLVLLWALILLLVRTVIRDVTPNPAGPAPERKSEKPPRGAGRLRRTSRLLVTAGPLAGTTLDIGANTVLVGRSPDSSLVLNDSYASARHAQFYNYRGQVYVEDLDSTNGTWINSQKIHHPVPLKPGMRVTIGKTVLELAQ